MSSRPREKIIDRSAKNTGWQCRVAQRAGGGFVEDDIIITSAFRFPPDQRRRVRPQITTSFSFTNTRQVIAIRPEKRYGLAIYHRNHHRGLISAQRSRRPLTTKGTIYAHDIGQRRRRGGRQAAPSSAALRGADQRRPRLSEDQNSAIDACVRQQKADRYHHQHHNDCRRLRPEQSKHGDHIACSRFVPADAAPASAFRCWFETTFEAEVA